MTFFPTENRRYSGWILAIAFGLRLLWAIAVPVVPISDSHAYDVFAQNLANGVGYGWTAGAPTAYWPVGTSFIYSLFYRLFGHGYSPIVIFNIFLSLLTIWLCMHLAKHYFDRRVAVVTGVLLALWPSQIQFTTVLASEQIFIALIVLALAVWVNNHLSLWLRSVVVGIVLAGASYVKPVALLIPILLLFLQYTKTRDIAKSLTSMVIMFVLMAMLIAPWTIRNTQEFGKFVVMSTNDGANLWMGNNPASTGGYMDLPPETEKMNEAERNQYLKSLAIAHIKERPDLFAFRAVKRIVDTHSRESIGVVWNEDGLTQRYGKRVLLPLKLINQFHWLAILGLGLVGVGFIGIREGWFKLFSHPMILFWAYFAGIHAVIVAMDRYHFPSIPMIAILAAFTITTGLTRLFKLKNRQLVSKEFELSTKPATPLAKAGKNSRI